MRFSRVVAVLVAGSVASHVAYAQTTEWHVSAGRDSFSFRDVARSRPPVDGSPVEWEGGGPTVGVECDRVRPFRLHQFELTFTSDGSFVYDTGVETIARPAADAARFLAFRYDYRRHLARALGVDGLRASVGVRAVGGRRVLRHDYGGDVALTQTDATGTGGFVAALRFRRSDRFTLDVDWTNGIGLLHGVRHHAADVAADDVSWGAGWLTDLAVRGEVRVAPRLGISLAWSDSGEGNLFDHRSYISERRRFMAGVTYVR